jgi:CheY-like chemotaxis protein/two-component sensor histidine kinase
MRGRIELRRETVELATIVARAVEIAQPLIEAQRHGLDIAVADESLLVYVDPVRLTQVLSNLVANAAKYTPPNGRIRVTAERDGQCAVLRVQDNGIGIAPNMQTQIFELFVQVDHDGIRSQGGLGIGLTLVKNLVEMHDGTVEARSEGAGRGSEFIVRIPISPVARRGAAARTSETVVPRSPSGSKVLVVDDNEDAAGSLATLLRLQGHDVRAAFSGREALEVVKNYVPDVALLDLGMPGMDGFELSGRLRQQPGCERVMLVALTGWGQVEDRRRTAAAGIDHHLVKPPDSRTLERLLTRNPTSN